MLSVQNVNVNKQNVKFGNLQSLWITSLYGSDLKRTNNNLTSTTNNNKIHSSKLNQTNTRPNFQLLQHQPEQQQQQLTHQPAPRKATQQKQPSHGVDDDNSARDQFSLQRFFRRNCDADFHHDQQHQQALQLHHPYNYDDYHQQQPPPTKSYRQPLEERATSNNKLTHKREPSRTTTAAATTRRRSPATLRQRIRDHEISETQFIGNSRESVMDEMVFQCNNQNSIYVLNSNYGIPAPAASATATTAHGDFRRLGLIDSPAGCRATSLMGNGGGSSGGGIAALRDGDVCSSVSRSLQDKLKNLGNFNGALLFGGNNGTAASAATTTTYSPAASSYAAYPLGNSNNNNGNSKSILHPNIGLTKCNVIGGGGGGGGGPTSTGSNMNGVVKSNLIAKKTKFWKYLEEEKLRNEVPPPPPRPQASHCSAKDFASCTDCYSPPTDAIVCADGNCCDNSCVNKSTAMAPAPNASQFSSQHHQQQSNNNKDYHQQQQQQQQQQQHPQYTSNNWSRNHDSNNLKPQQQQQTPTQKSKEAAEMYKEAAELLGLTCTLCDNCRCLDCQSGYFDCDDSDSYSEFSLMDEYDVDDLDIVDIVVGGGGGGGGDDYGAAQNASAAAAYANSPTTTTHKLLAMHADNMTALCCDILHSQQATSYERQAAAVEEEEQDEGAAFGDGSGHCDVDEDDASRSITATVMTGMQRREEATGTSSGTDEMNTAAITSASSSRTASDGPTEPTIDQVALHNIKSTMLPQATADAAAAAAARPTPPTTIPSTPGMAKGCGVRGNDLENCSNFDGLRLSDSYGPGERR